MQIGDYILIHHKNTTWIGQITHVKNYITYKAITKGFDQIIGGNYGVDSNWIIASFKENNFKDSYPELFI